MATKRSDVFRGGNTEELEKLEKEVAHLKDVQERILEQKRALEKERGELLGEIKNLKEANKIAYETIRGLQPLEKTSETMTRGYVEIATVPFNGIVPPPSKVDGVIVPRRRDDDGIVYETLPVQNAIRMMTDGSIFKRYLVGPEDVYVIKGRANKGMYLIDVEFKKHRKVANPKTKFEFIAIELEDSEQKAV